MAKGIRRDRKKYMAHCLVLAVLLIPVVGLGQGTLYSHGFNIHWVFFGVVNFIFVMIVASLFVAIETLYHRIK